MTVVGKGPPIMAQSTASFRSTPMPTPRIDPHAVMFQPPKPELHVAPARRSHPPPTALWLALAAAGALPTCDTLAAVTHVVTTCADSIAPVVCDGVDDGTLRKALRCAQDQDTIDLAQLQCSTITLAGPLIAGPLSVTLNGPGRGKLTIDAGGRFRAFIHYGAGTDELTINKLTIANGHYENPYSQGGDGGCIYSSAYLQLNSVAVASCYTSTTKKPASGGAIYARSGAGLTDSIVTGSTAHGRNAKGSYGGGIAAKRVSLTRTVVSDNTASSAYGFGIGGGIHADDVDILASTISGNTAETGGGAIYCRNIFLIDSTVSGNHTMPYGLAGGIYARRTTQIYDSTIANNGSGVGVAAGLHASLDSYAQAFVTSTIIAGNTAGSDDLDLSSPAGHTVYGSNNLIVKTIAGTSTPGDTITLDPKLGPLRDNGGPTPTRALLPGSPAIDKGSNVSGAATDQRGVSRSANGKPDIGAFESDDVFTDGFD